MILEHFGLREEPFGMTPDPAYLYASRTHSEALASISSGIRDTRGFLALIAEPGMGKTTLLYQLAQELRETTRIVHVSQTQCDSREFIEYILQELGVDVGGISFVAMHGKLNEILFEELLAGKRFLLIVDEAQNLDDSVLETVRMLSNFETHNAKLLQILLAGQPQLATKLAQPRLSQLRQRVAVFGRLEPFSAEDAGRYIEHRLKVAGYSGEPIFAEEPVGLITRFSKGIPRNINNLCYHGLRLAHARGLRTVTPEMVQESAALLDVEALAHPPAPAAALAAAAHASAPAAHTAAPAATAKPAALKTSAAIPAAIPVAGTTEKGTQPGSLLTYDPSAKAGTSKWPARSAILGAAVLSVTLLVSMLVRSQSKRTIAPENVNSSPNSNTLGASANSDASTTASANYDADPQDTGDGQVLTVAAGPQDTLKALSIRYAGRYDNELAGKIRTLNPDLKDPDHLEEGQLIRIPLPPGAMKKVNDTEEPLAPPKAQPPQGLFGRFTAMLRGRK
jgi:type II secretory pathway predicted ATPase ExeA